MPQEDYTPLLIGAGALLILAKWGLGNIPNPLPKIGAAAVKTADELTGGLQKDRDESLPEFLFEFDVPFSEKRFPIAPGLVPDRGAVYSTGGPQDPGGQMADVPWGAPIDIAEPDQSTGSFLFEIDLPGVPAYDLRSAPGDIYRGTIGRIL
jgi:hypothetical protein|tara:strand:+ start:1478 stop:1930 length:453 start_codon:yes stop_codon:yes gene_type:complete